MNTARRMTVIPATMNIKVQSSVQTFKKRVAAYARVSTDSEEQLSSYAAQVSYYTDYIKNNENWDYVNVYTDEGISATNTKHRDGFNKMIADALAGKIDLIITKSVSRFARNTVDTLTTVRKLKEKGVEVYFEKENIYTMDSKGELLITIMSSLAQEESRSISENVTWGQRKRFADGKINIPYKNFLGYEKGEDGLPKIVEKEAKIIRLIYKMFLEGKTPSFIASYLTAQGIPTPAKKTVWQPSTVLSILKNEKYKGDAVLQKTFTVDFLTKKKKINEGEVQQYYIENSHSAIIPPETYDLVQIELGRRKGAHKSTAGTFAGKLICGDCGSFYGSKVWHSNDKYRRVIMQCNGKFKNTKQCRTPNLEEEQLKHIFVDVFNSTFTNRHEIITSIASTIDEITDTSKIDLQIENKRSKLQILGITLKECIEENMHRILNQDEYDVKFKTLENEYENLKADITRLENLEATSHAKKQELYLYIHALETTDHVITEFDESLFHSLVDNIIVNADNTLVFRYKDGSSIIWDLKKNAIVS